MPRRTESGLSAHFTTLMLLVAGLLAPVPLLLLHIVEALVQAYIFGMLTLIYIAGALQTQKQSREAAHE